MKSIRLIITPNLMAGLLLCAAAGNTHAQTGDPKKDKNVGELESVVIEIQNTRVINLPQANRNFDKIPPRPAETIKTPMKYDFRSFSFAAPQVSPVVKPLKLKAVSESTIYGGFLRAGYGNYASPLLEGYINSRKDKDKLIGAHFRHNSSGKGPVDGKNSGSGNTALSLFARSFNQHIAVSGNADFENRTTHFYGYPTGTEVNKSAIKQSWNVYRLGGELANSSKSNFAYKLNAGFSFLTDKYKARESEVDLDFNGTYALDEDRKINIKAGYYVISRKDSAVEAKPRNLFTVTPSYNFITMESLRLKVGFTLAFEDDSIDTKGVHFYPEVQASYPISPTVDFVAGLTGGMQKVSLQSLSYQNMWLAPNVPIFHTNKYYDLGLGVNAKLGNKVSANAGLGFASFKNQYFFINSLEDQAKFDVVYNDRFTQRTNLYAALSYVQSETVKFLLRGDYYTYSTDGFGEAWHMPRYKLAANASFNVYQKLLFKLDLIGQGGMKALDTNTLQTVTLKGALDANIKMEYIFSDSFSAFVQLNNIANNKYPVFLNYPVRGFQALAGITWSF